MKSFIEPYMVLDVGMYVFLIIGGLVGYYRGAIKAGITLASFYLPYLIYLHFSDQISDYTSKIINLTIDTNTSGLGVLGTFTGLMGAIGLFGLFFLASRFIMRLFANHEPEMREKLGGALVGTFGNQFMAMLSLMLVFMALPAATADTTAKSLWWKMTKPVARVIFPVYRELIYDRTERLRASIAEGGLLKGVASGGGFDLEGQLEAIITDGAGVAEILTEELTATLGNIDLDNLQAEVEKLTEEGLTADDVDRRIREEEARRRQMVDDQLNGN
ncbi:MAG: hypothetical protein J4F41_00450 [Alphaproteobacteria bacterium]|nr:hypothetical protein [Alphaproteobacteria bacterium]